MRLKPAGIIIVLVIIAVLAYFALKPKTTEVASQTTEISTTQPQDKPANDPPPATKSNGTNDREFNYTPEMPVNGTL
ncbi:MAG: hypothetical protein ABIP80_07370, partial [Ferruginibacter sp.]